MGKRNRRGKDKMAKNRQNPPWKDIVKENIQFQQYYKKQDLITNEWDTFMEYCRKDLPSTFRITKIRGHAKDLLQSLKEGYISKVASESVKIKEQSEQNLSCNDDDAEKEQDLFLEPIVWYPEELAWNSNLSRRFIRRSEVLQKLHRFLVEDAECGAISRQESVSMIPPLLLDVQSNHLVLDMCAAPGSKTAQIIEMMHADSQDSMPTGAVLANDADHKRCYMLTHQIKRLNTPCAIVTNHDASIYPKIHFTGSDGKRTQLEFDRVLCDVPCSGDGTIRKNPLLWHKWTPHLGNALHRLQMRILIRGLELLKTGGRLVYSTCSFNPIENEAVIAAVLKEANHTVELVDCSADLPLLKRRAGIKNWSVSDRYGNTIEKYDEELSKTTSSIKETMFPPTKEVADDICLERCMRIYPHLQNTGGFFIAVLEKKKDLPWQKVKRAWKSLPWDDSNKPLADVTTGETTSLEDIKTSEVILSDKIDSPPAKKSCPEEVIGSEDSVVPSERDTEKEETSQPTKIKRGMIKEDPYIFLDDRDTDLRDVREFYGISNELPSKLFLVRSTGATKKRHIYLVSEKVNIVMTENKHLKVINTGVKVVTRSPFRAGKVEHGVEFRLVQDGLPLIQNFVSNRIIAVTYQDLVAVISKNETKMTDFDQRTQILMEKIDMGCVVWHYTAGKIEDQPELSSDLWLCGHKGRVCAQVMLNRDERKHYLRILGVPIPSELEKEVKGPSWGDDSQKTEVASDKFEKESDNITEE